MKRRQFLHSAGAATLPMLLNGLRISAAPAGSIFSTINPEIDRALVLIQLNGGNDGLNTLIPLDQYSNLFKARPNVLVPENSILKIADTAGLHPAMKSLKWTHDEGKIGFVQSVGYPNQNRSHFRSIDIWTSGSPANEFWTTGWLGRNFDGLYPGFPDDYPNNEYPDPFAITMGRIVSETCQGTAANYSMTLSDPFSLYPLPEGAESEIPNTPYGRELEFLRTTIAQTNAYSERITEAAEKGNNLATYPEGNNLAEQLRNVALLIAGGLQTKVYVCSLGGFDTHANQVVEASTSTGIHAALLSTLSDAIASFQEDLQMLGIEQKVIGATFSEFGRQIKSNDSLGTDHGTAAPLMLFGACVNPQILGENPEIPSEVEVQEGVPMQYDFRDIYGSILQDWFELEETDVKSLLHEDYQRLPIITPCQELTSAKPDLRKDEEIDLKNYPNPFENWTTISFKTRREKARLSVYDALGNEVRVLLNRELEAGTHQVRFDGHSLAPGSYFYRLQLANGVQRTRRTIKFR